MSSSCGESDNSAYEITELELSEQPSRNSTQNDLFDEGGSVLNNEAALASQQSPASMEDDALFRESFSEERAMAVYRNFCLMSILFSAVPGSALACLSLATARLGNLGAWQSGTLYLSYTLSSVTISTYVVKQMGSRQSLILGMSLYCVYTGFFFLSALFPEAAKELALLGALIGGAGAGILWTAQGSYFTEASEEYSTLSGKDLSETTSSFGGTFAFTLLAEETSLDLFSTLLVHELKVHWAVVFCVYFIVALLAIGGMVFIKQYPIDGHEGQASTCNKAAATINLLVNDSKMKYMIGLNASFGFAGAFVDSFVNGEVVPVALNDPKASLVGLFDAIRGSSAALASLGFGHLSNRIGKGPILYFGAICFAWVAAPFLIQPDANQWTFLQLVGVYLLQGVGRATFEGTLKACFVDFFSYAKEAAFGNIVLLNGVSGAVAYVLTVEMKCSRASTYCVEYRDGSLHNIGTLSGCVILTSVIGIVGFARASCLQNTMAPLFSRSRRIPSGDQLNVHRKKYNSVDVEHDPLERVE